MGSYHYAFVPPSESCETCIESQPGRRYCCLCTGSKFLVCKDCHGLANLPCPDCDGNGKVCIRVPLASSGNSVISSKPCNTCMWTGTVSCPECLGIGAMRCAGCRGLGHTKCECAISNGYASEQL